MVQVNQETQRDLLCNKIYYLNVHSTLTKTLGKIISHTDVDMGSGMGMREPVYVRQIKNFVVRQYGKKH